MQSVVSFHKAVVVHMCLVSLLNVLLCWVLGVLMLL